MKESRNPTAAQCGIPDVAPGKAGREEQEYVQEKSLGDSEQQFSPPRPHASSTESDGSVPEDEGLRPQAGSDDALHGEAKSTSSEVALPSTSPSMEILSEGQSYSPPDQEGQQSVDADPSHRNTTFFLPAVQADVRDSLDVNRLSDAILMALQQDPIAGWVTGEAKMYSHYKIGDVKGDGNCLFRAVAYMHALYKKEPGPDACAEDELADEYREAAMQHLLSLREIITRNSGLNGNDVDKYAEEMARSGELWGGDLELYLLSECNKIPITVYMNDDNSTGDCRAIRATKIYGEHFLERGHKPVRVLFDARECHYQKVLEISEDKNDGILAGSWLLSGILPAAAIAVVICSFGVALNSSYHALDWIWK